SPDGTTSSRHPDGLSGPHLVEPLRPRGEDLAAPFVRLEPPGPSRRGPDGPPSLGLHARLLGREHPPTEPRPSAVAVPHRAPPPPPSARPARPRRHDLRKRAASRPRASWSG